MIRLHRYIIDAPGHDRAIQYAQDAAEAVAQWCSAVKPDLDASDRVTIHEGDETRVYTVETVPAVEYHVTRDRT